MRKAKSKKRRRWVSSLAFYFWQSLKSSVDKWLACAGLVAATLFLSVLPKAVADLPIPSLTSAVIDEVGLLNRRDADEIRQALIELNRRDVVQIQVAILTTLGDLSIEEASIRMVDAWKLGSKDRSNGILILLVPSERRVRIEVGRGLEGRIPDVVTKRIVSDQMTPLFRRGQYAAGIAAAIATIAELSGLEFSDRLKTSHDDWSTIFVILAIVFAFVLITTVFRRGPRGLGPGGWGRPTWGSGGSWDRGSSWGSGGGWGGGSSGGGWSGGGGSFGGGGASGSW